MKNSIFKIIAISVIIGSIFIGCNEDSSIDRYTSYADNDINQNDRVKNDSQIILAPLNSTFAQDIKMYGIADEDETNYKAIRKAYSMSSYETDDSSNNGNSENSENSDSAGSDGDSGKNENSSESENTNSETDTNSDKNYDKSDTDQNSENSQANEDEKATTEDSEEDADNDDTTEDDKQYIPSKTTDNYDILGDMSVTLNHKNYGFTIAKYNYGNTNMQPTLKEQSNGKFNLSMRGYFIEDDKVDLEYGTFGIVINNIDLDINSDYYKVESNILTNSAEDDVYAYVIVEKNGDSVRVIVTVQSFMVYNQDKTKSYEAKFNVTAESN